MAAKRIAEGYAPRTLRQAGAGRATLLLVLVVAACSSSPGAAGNEPATTGQTASIAASPGKLSVTSTLDRHTTLPVRIHWQAFPSAPASGVSEVDFLIDGRLGWVEHKTPYFYGDDGNWLVTSFLTPGEHSFTVRVHDPTGGGLLFDVGYGTARSLQMRPAIEYPPYPNSNNGGFCQDTDPLWAWTYSVGDNGKTLTLRPVGHDPCGDRIAILAGTWTRTAK